MNFMYVSLYLSGSCQLKIKFRNIKYFNHLKVNPFCNNINSIILQKNTF